MSNSENHNKRSGELGSERSGMTGRAGEEEFLLVRVGLMQRPRGVRGELIVLPLTDDVRRFKTLKNAYAERAVPAAPAEPAEPVIIEDVRFHRGQPIVKLAGCDDIDGALRYKGRYLSVTRDQLMPLGDNAWYVFDLIGCEARDPSGAALGVLRDVIETGSADVYVIRGGDGGELLAPAIKRVVKKVDIENKTIVIDMSAIGFLDPQAGAHTHTGSCDLTS